MSDGRRGDNGPTSGGARAGRARWVVGVTAVALVAVAAGGCTAGSGAETEVTPETSTTSTTVPRGADVAVPTVTGPVTGGAHGMPFNPLPGDLAQRHDYVEQEYVLSGDATAYEAAGEQPWGPDGEWTAVADHTAPYRTRLLVRRPRDADAFDGTVVVEWLNVSSGMDSDPGFGLAHEELLRRGAVWVGVSAQAVGVEGGGFEIPIEGFEAQPLVEWDPARYGSLEHPGDEYSYDIFSQAAQALRRPGEVDPLGGLVPEVVLATGESQSAIRMVTYVDAVQPVADIYDGFVIHSRGGTGAPLHGGDGEPVPPGPAHIRADLDVPVLQFETETDLFGLGFEAARQDDTPLLRTWEVAGTAHADQATLDYGFASGREYDQETELDFAGMCGGPLNTGPQGLVLRRAYSDLAAWARGGDPPASAPPIEVAGDAVARDADGNALGGVRTPAVDAPVSTLSGEPRPGASVICSLFGSTTPFPPEVLAARYPTTADYVAAVTRSADAAVAAGHLLEADRDELVAAAREGVPA